MCDGLRFVAGLGVGAILSHLGWGLLHASALVARPTALLDLSSGYSLLFVPLGALVVAPWSTGLAAASRFIGAAHRCLPIAFAVARLGCLLEGCCAGTPISRTPGFVSAFAELAEHPTPLYEIAGWLLLHRLLARAPALYTASLAMAGIGVVRLAVEPWRAEPALGAPAIGVWVFGSAWLGLAALALAATRGRPVRGCD